MSEERSPGIRQRSIVPGLTVVLVVAGLATAAWWGIGNRAKAMDALTRETNELAVPTMALVGPKHATPQEEIILPGSVQAFADAPIYARTSCYLRRRTVDIGSHVQAGELLAEIDAPELEQQLQQAHADVATAEANLRLAQITA